MSDFIPPGLVPPGVSDQRSHDFVAALSQTLEGFRTSSLLVQDPLTVDARLLPSLTVELGMSDFMTPGLREEHVRRLLSRAAEIHTMTGTVAGARRAFDAIGIEIDWLQWWQMRPKGPHDTHKVTAYLSDGLLAAQDMLFSAASRTVVQRVIQATQRESQSIELALGFRAAFEDAAPPEEEASVGITQKAADDWDWGLVYDGSTNHDHAVRQTYDGTSLHNGSITHIGWRRRIGPRAGLRRRGRRLYDDRLHYNGRADHSGWAAAEWTGAGALYDNCRWAMTTGVRLGVTDRPGIDLFHDGNHTHDATFSHGGTQPAVTDIPMPMIVLHHRRHDGRHRHGGDRHDGAIRYDAARPYHAGIFHSGASRTQLMVR